MPEVEKTTKAAKENHGVESGQTVSSEKINEMKQDSNLQVNETADGKVKIKEKLEE